MQSSWRSLPLPLFSLFKSTDLVFSAALLRHSGVLALLEKQGSLLQGGIGVQKGGLLCPPKTPLSGQRIGALVCLRLEFPGTVLACND